MKKLLLVLVTLVWIGQNTTLSMAADTGNPTGVQKENTIQGKSNQAKEATGQGENDKKKNGQSQGQTKTEDDKKITDPIAAALAKVIGTLSITKGAAFIVAIYLVYAGLQIYRNFKNDSPLASHAFELLVITFILPVLLIVGILTDKGQEAVIGVIGTIVGYVFGTQSAKRRDDPGSHPPANPQTPPPTGEPTSTAGK